MSAVFQLESQKVGLPSVLMYGGGRQTIAICVLIIQGKLPVPDFTLIADTEREKSSTWEYLEKWVQPNYPQEIIFTANRRTRTPGHNSSTAQLTSAKE